MLPFLLTSLVLFILGLFTCLTKKNAIGLLMGIEMILNAAGLNFVTFAHFRGNLASGSVMALFIIVLAAAEAVVAFAILVGIYRRFGDIDTQKTTELKE